MCSYPQTYLLLPSNLSAPTLKPICSYPQTCVFLPSNLSAPTLKPIYSYLQTYLPPNLSAPTCCTSQCLSCIFIASTTAARPPADPAP
eukprot:2188060-Rhodomonas_salina.1